MRNRYSILGLVMFISAFASACMGPLANDESSPSANGASGGTGGSAGQASDGGPSDAASDADGGASCIPGAQEACACANGGLNGVHVCASDGVSYGLCTGCGDGGTQLCTPGAQVACACVGGAMGVQVCATDGMSLGACTSCPGSDAGSGDGGVNPLDTDGDGWVDTSDNCPNAWNPVQQDLDGDGLGDACDSDVDGDSSPTALDCNDRDATVHPGAPELCDGLDNDCDSQTDEGCVNPTGSDTDQDGICDPGSAMVGCTGSDNCPFIANANQANLDGDAWGDLCDTDVDGDGSYAGADCNDANAAVHPGAAETCNGLDDDCDQQTDEGCGSTNGYVQVTYHFTTPQSLLKGYISIYHEANDSLGALLPRTNPYGPFNTTLYGAWFAWGVAWDGGSTACDFKSQSTVDCPVHLPKSSSVHANVHFGNVGADSNWSCATALGGTLGVFSVTDKDGALIPLSWDVYPLPGGSSVCRYTYTAPAN